MEDSELLQQFVTRNSQPAFAEVVRRHTDWLYAICHRRIGDASLAEDATQAVFLVLARKAPSLTNMPTLSPWLYRAAKFASNNIRRAMIRRTRHETKAVTMKPAESSPQLFSAEAFQFKDEIEPLLDRLKARDLQAILLRFYEQKTGAQIALQLGISQKAAQKRVSRALDRVRELYMQNGRAIPAPAISAIFLSHPVSPSPQSLVQKLSSLSASEIPPHLSSIAQSIVPVKAKLIFSMAVALLSMIVLFTAFPRSRNQSPLQPLAAATELSAASGQSRTILLNVTAQIDGSDVLNITPDGITWTHIAWQWPTGIILNRLPMNPHAQFTLNKIALESADLSSARVEMRTGRGISALEHTAAGIAIHFSDPEPGNSPYQMKISFKPKTAAAPTAPATRPAEKSSVLEVKAILEGSGILNINPDGARWQSQNGAWPSDVTINGHPWDVRAHPTSDDIGLPDVDFSSAAVISHTGRDTVVMERAENGIQIFFSDALGGASAYEIKIGFANAK